LDEGAFFWACKARPKKPGFPLQSFLPLRGKKGFPLQSLARAVSGFSRFRATIIF
jgi:hypothetical protein